MLDDGRVVDQGTHDELSIAAPSTGRSPITGSSTGRSCSATSRSARRWRGFELAERRPGNPDEELEREDEQRESETRAPLGDAWLLVKSIWRTIRGEDGRGRKVRWLFGLLRPYRSRVALMMVALVIATAAALAPPYLGRARDRQGHRPQPRLARPELLGADLDRRRVPRLGRDLLGCDIRADIPRRLGRPARPPGSARADLHPSAGDVARLLHAEPAGGADLADDQRRPGPRHARHRRHRDHGLQRADARRRDRDPARDRRRARA